MPMGTNETTTSTVSLASVTLEVPDAGAAHRFYTAFGVEQYVRLRESGAPSSGFRGFALALTVSRPATVDAFLATAVDAGATLLKPAAKSLWGYGGVVQAPDGTAWKVATSAKRDSGPATREIDDVVLLLGVANVKATREFYVGQGLTVARSFGGKYTEFASGGPGAVKLALYKRPALAKEVGVPADGTGSHRIVLGSTAGSFADPDGFVWEAVTPAASAPATRS
ncbi:glyoxalase [Kitasatospora sp. NPDC001539]|uniref:glyoxalase n=1 Tax=Kitasatospora sp. NPDC001539 TaxID=3154384 RepID=UPI00333121E2